MVASEIVTESPPTTEIVLSPPRTVTTTVSPGLSVERVELWIRDGLGQR